MRVVFTNDLAHTEQLTKLLKGETVTHVYHEPYSELTITFANGLRLSVQEGGYEGELEVVAEVPDEETHK